MKRFGMTQRWLTAGILGLMMMAGPASALSPSDVARPNRGQIGIRVAQASPQDPMQRDQQRQQQSDQQQQGQAQMDNQGRGQINQSDRAPSQSEQRTTDQAGQTQMDQGQRGQGQAAGSLQIGQSAPDIQLNDWNNKQISLSDFRDQAVVIVYSNPDCPFVKRHEQQNTLLNLANQHDDVKFLLISDKAHPEADKYEGKVTTINDQNHQFARQWGVTRTPEVFVLDKQGRVAYHGAFDNDPQGSMSQDQRKSYVADALQAIKNDQTPPVQHSDLYGCKVKHQGDQSGQSGMSSGSQSDQSGQSGMSGSQQQGSQD